MIKHIVFFKLKEKDTESLNQLVTALRGLSGVIESLRFLEVGIDFLQSPRSFDVVLTTHFDDQAGFDFYRNHPLHQPVIQLAQSLCTQLIAVDYDV